MVRTFWTAAGMLYWAVIIAISLWVYRDLAGIGIALRDGFAAAIGRALGQ